MDNVYSIIAQMILFWDLKYSYTTDICPDMNLVLLKSLLQKRAVKRYLTHNACWWNGWSYRG